MSVTHPLIKELKGIVSALHADRSNNRDPLSDLVPEVVLFCDCLERILNKGLLPRSGYFQRKQEVWPWVKKLSAEKYGSPYTYTSAVDSISDCSKVCTNQGRLRLFIRTALVNKCLHTPVQMLVHLKKQSLYYEPGSILGDEILTELLVSILLICSKLQFDLNIKTCRFLDETWNIPESKTLTVVPCTELGISVMFVSKIPLIVSIIPNSVADDIGGISIGDILDEVNGKAVTTADQGCLYCLIKDNAGPISLHIIKAASKGTIYPPLIRVLREAGLDPIAVADKSLPDKNDDADDDELDELFDKSVEFVTVEGTGDKSDVKQIHLAINRYLSRIKPSDQSKTEQSPFPQVVFSFHDLGIRVRYKDPLIGDLLFQHSFMEISCCGCTTSVPQYFAYIAGNTKDYINCTDYKCYIFYSTNQILVEKILRSIAQGFKRTLCTV